MSAMRTADQNQGKTRNMVIGIIPLKKDKEYIH